MEEVDRYYQGNITLEEAESYIASGMMTAVRAFVANGYYLRRIRDEKLYKESGYKNFKEYLEDRYKKDEGWASKCIKVNQQLSVGGNSPILDSKYCDYNDKYKLVELAGSDGRGAGSCNARNSGARAGEAVRLWHTH